VVDVFEHVQHGSRVFHMPLLQLPDDITSSPYAILHLLKVCVELVNTLKHVSAALVCRCSSYPEEWLLRVLVCSFLGLL